MLKFFREVAEEATKLQLPTKKETYITALVIIVITIVAAISITVTDFAISKIIKFLFGLGN